MSKKLMAFFSFFIILTFAVTSEHAHASQVDKIISIAKEQMGTKYTYAGSSPSTGFDCSGFLYYVFSQAGESLPRTSASQYNSGEAVAKSDLQKGDLVFFNTSGSGVSHSGIYVGDNKFIHASTSKGVIISSINDPYYWGKRYVGAKRVVEDAVVEQKSLTPLPLGYFHDVPENHWAFGEVKNLTVEGIINGYEDGLFNPDGLVTRAQAATLITLANDLTSTTTAPFTDVPANHWAANTINAAVEAGYFEAGGTFEPNKAMTRAEVAVLFARAYDLPSTNGTITFKDVPSSYWAFAEINQVAAADFVRGFDDNTFRPSEQVTRAQFAKILHTAMNSN